MQSKYLLFLEDALAPIVSAYLSEHLDAEEPILLEKFPNCAGS